MPQESTVDTLRSRIQGERDRPLRYYAQNERIPFEELRVPFDAISGDTEVIYILLDPFPHPATTECLTAWHEYLAKLPSDPKWPSTLYPSYNVIPPHPGDTEAKGKNIWGEFRRSNGQYTQTKLDRAHLQAGELLELGGIKFNRLLWPRDGICVHTNADLEFTVEHGEHNKWPLAQFAK